ncbi:MAG: radical SAM family heme chaperone HemW [Bacteroidaceae bacterium]|nr:radical SAM family heme chaperone HemW [Bacteroidaceae bacterium]
MSIPVFTKSFIRNVVTKVGGVYIHVPFCKKRCIYCDFYSTTSGFEWKRSYISALKREMRLRRSEIDFSRVPSLYIGGGTPSQLPSDLLIELFQTAKDNFTLSEGAEVTIEVNPDDVTPSLIDALRQTPVNRISMGVQTFRDEMLRFLNRRHTSEQALQAVQLFRDAGYGNISLDLIYGLPSQTFEAWTCDVQQLLKLSVPHLSAYALSYENGTPLYKMLQGGEVSEASDELSWRMYEYLMDETKASGYEHYEISNFAKPGMRARHNSSYWDGSPYLGLGPGAHSYDGDNVRRSNNTSLEEYVSAIADVPHQLEVLSREEQYDELIMTRLRTASGLYLRALTPEQESYCLQMAEQHLCWGNLIREGDILRLSRKGIFISNSVISDLMC